MNGFGKIDLHIHTTVSDGTYLPEEVLAFVREGGFSLFSVTDHDAFKGCRIIAGLLLDGDPGFLSGAEFSCRDEEGQYHILGYGFDPDAGSVNELVERGHEFRMKKLKERLDFLRREFGIRFSEADVEHLFALDNPGKPHIAQIMVRDGLASTIPEAVDSFLNRIRFRNEYLRPEEVIRGILSAGGIPVLAHPTFGPGDQLIMGEALDARIQKLAGFGLLGAEAYYPGFSGEQRGEILGLAERYGLYVTAGSDCHGTNKQIPLGKTGLEDGEELPEGLRRFIEDTRERRMK
ncbi:MAG: PHP domain-containing protein [Clostridia bacterium]|nr:PHP domain-containing protein [Clostridia bacterium]